MHFNIQNPRTWSAAATLFGLLALQGCFVSADDGHSHPAAVVEVPPAQGSLVVDWTIERAKDTRDCDDNDAASIRIDIDTLSGRPFDSVEDDCGAFQTVIDLDPGDYSGS